MLEFYYIILRRTYEIHGASRIEYEKPVQEWTKATLTFMGSSNLSRGTSTMLVKKNEVDQGDMWTQVQHEVCYLLDVMTWILISIERLFSPNRAAWHPTDKTPMIF